ncbi:MAG: hypothetical protein P8N09_09715 [Planctomycetota bacterium]|jgi:hypothetical protein|nr:hypothetical protein [Planctomycetota bacterium]
MARCRHDAVLEPSPSVCPTTRLAAENPDPQPGKGLCRATPTAGDSFTLADEELLQLVVERAVFDGRIVFDRRSSPDTTQGLAQSVTTH